MIIDQAMSLTGYKKYSLCFLYIFKCDLNAHFWRVDKFEPAAALFFCP